MAVDDRVKPMAPTKATCGRSPLAIPTSVSKVPQVATCAAPMPKICRRIFHSRDGCISRPITNRNITMPNSATLRMASVSPKNPSPCGPISSPAVR